MASSGSVSTGGYGSRYLKFDWWVNSQSIANNTTTIGWSLVGAGGNTNDYYKAGNFYVSIDGSQAYYSETRINLFNGTTVASGTKTLTHDSNGNKSFEVYVEAGIYSVAVNVSGRDTFTLNKIQRASQPSLITYPSTTTNVTIGDTIKIHMNRASTSFTHTVRYSWFNKNATIATGVVDNCSWTIPEHFCDDIPNSTSGWGTIYVDTYSGSTFIGTKSVTFVGNINTNTIRPTFPTYTVSEASDVVPSDWGIFVRTKSKLKFVISATAGRGANIKSITTKIDGVTYTGEEIETNVINTAGSITVDVSVTDTRGITSSSAKGITIIDYDLPYITEATAIRSDLSGKESDQGTYIKVTLVAGVSSAEGYNTASYKLYYKKTTEDSWSVYTFSSDEITYDGYVRVPAIDTNSSYDVKIGVTDYFTEVFKVLPTIPTAFTTVDYLNGGHGMAIGKVAEEEGILEVAFKTKFTGGIEYISLESGADLNDLTTPNFYDSGDVTTSNYSNCPITSGTFSLEVLSCGEAIKQRLSCISEENISYERNYLNETWSEWDCIGTWSGSNDNGEWIKYGNGTMICRQTVKGTIDITTAWGSLYSSESMTLPDFPMTFIERPTITVSPQTQTGTQYMITGNGGGSSGNAAHGGNICLIRPLSRTGVAYILDIVAVGKWK